MERGDARHFSLGEVATVQNANALMNIMVSYYNESGQQVNVDKSRISFAPRFRPDLKQDICSLLPIRIKMVTLQFVGILVSSKIFKDFRIFLSEKLN